MSPRRWWPPLAWAAVVLFLTSLPGADLPRVAVPHLDKLVHATIYGILGWLIARAMLHSGKVTRSALIVILGVSLFGAIDEWHQQFIPGRSMELFDWFADMLGAATGFVAGAATPRREMDE